ncbi:hypothetical protein CYMTET_39955 [Cymbomonas tetramitiformis]|uniref:DNA-(apurinic or apyrimidinic site) lyase n=1 Tax=Cymbomonas tetramitiformis TaxID=36881 RepID=A0AAE0F404_9CHLO|nr:hypothetical protein CYMTET_39955 [Cymbomonas tetramitiformis]
MVEGPQCRLKTLKLAILCQQRVKQLASYQSSNTSEALQKAADLSVQRVFSVGKECFVVFSTCALRFHFGMSGSVRMFNISSKVPPQLGRKRKTLNLVLDRHVVELYDSNVQMKTLEYVAKQERNANRDIIGEEFDFQHAVELLLNDQRPVCDSVMDQDILPGVGNVIKCEGLFRSAIHPQTRTSDLGQRRLLVLLRELRDFAKKWYDCCARGAAIRKQVYGHDKCEACSSVVTLIRYGSCNRISYFCSQCQRPGAPWAEQQCVPSEDPPHLRSGVTEPAFWSCSACTYHNLRLPGSTDSCEMCGSVQQDTAKPSIGCKRDFVQLDCDEEPPTVAVSSTTSSSNLQAPLFVGGPREEHPPLTPLSCKCNSPSALQRVRKPGPNHSRLFWSCPKRHGKGCGFFRWADEEFPKCQHAKRSLLRRVLKPGANNGRYFYCCAQAKSLQCNFFAWVKSVENYNRLRPQSQVHLGNHEEQRLDGNFNSSLAKGQSAQAFATQTLRKLFYHDA